MSEPALKRIIYCNSPLQENEARSTSFTETPNPLIKRVTLIHILRYVDAIDKSTSINPFDIKYRHFAS